MVAYVCNKTPPWSMKRTGMLTLIRAKGASKPPQKSVEAVRADLIAELSALTRATMDRRRYTILKSSWSLTQLQRETG